MYLFRRNPFSSVAAATLAVVGLTVAVTPASGKDKVLERVVVVSGGGAAASNGLALLEAFDDVALGKGPCSNPGPSAAAPCLVRIGPGIFDIGGSFLQMLEFVDVEGSGQSVTTILGSAAEGLTVRFTDGNNELRDLTVEYNGTSSSNTATAIANNGSPQNVRIMQVTARATSTTTDHDIGIGIGGGSTFVLTDVVAVAEGGTLGRNTGILVGGTAQAQMHNVRASGEERGLTVVNEASVTANGSAFEGGAGTDGSVFVGNGAQAASADIQASLLTGDIRARPLSTLSIATSQVDGAVHEEPGGFIDCVFAYDAMFTPLNANCE